MSVYSLAEKAKDNLNIDSDTKLAKKLGVKRANVSHWKIGRNLPDAITMLKLVELAGLSAHDALNLVTQDTQKERPASTKNCG